MEPSAITKRYHRVLCQHDANMLIGHKIRPYSQGSIFICSDVVQSAFIRKVHPSLFSLVYKPKTLTMALFYSKRCCFFRRFDPHVGICLN